MKRFPKPRKQKRVRDDSKNIHTVEEYMPNMWDELRTELHRLDKFNIYFIHEEDGLFWTSFLRNVSWGRCSVAGINPGGGINLYFNIERMHIFTEDELNLYVYTALPTTCALNVKHKIDEKINIRSYVDKVRFLDEGIIPSCQMFQCGFDEFIFKS